MTQYSPTPPEVDPAETTVYFAKWILLPDCNVLENGAIAVTRGEITGIGQRSQVKKSSRNRTVNLGKRLLLPGLINMHTHLEESLLQNHLVDPHGAYSSWMIGKERGRKIDDPTFIESVINLNIRVALANGITTIVDSSRTGLSHTIAASTSVRLFHIHEFHQNPEDETLYTKETLQELIASRFLESDKNKAIGTGPYAFFSLPPHLHKVLINYTKENNLLWACHAAESSQELQAFAERSGELYTYLTKKHPWSFDDHKRGALYHMVAGNLIPKNAILYHCNYAAPEELSLLAPKNVSIIICPQYSDILGHKRFPLESALNRGINLCVGTETPVSLYGMDLFDELFHLRQECPHLPVKLLFDWVTHNPARALRLSHMIGSLTVGKRADIIGMPLTVNSGEDILEEAINQQVKIDFVMVDGKEILLDH